MLAEGSIPVTESRSGRSLTEFLLRGDELVSTADEAMKHALCPVNPHIIMLRNLNRRIEWRCVPCATANPRSRWRPQRGADTRWFHPRRQRAEQMDEGVAVVFAVPLMLRRMSGFGVRHDES